MIRERGGFEVYSKRATSVFGLVAMGLSASGGPAALADNECFQPGNFLLSRVVYDNNPKTVQARVTQAAAKLHDPGSVCADNER
jgi:hypothetical protein